MLLVPRIWPPGSRYVGEGGTGAGGVGRKGAQKIIVS